MRVAIVQFLYNFNVYNLWNMNVEVVKDKLRSVCIFRACFIYELYWVHIVIYSGHVLFVTSLS